MRLKARRHPKTFNGAWFEDEARFDPDTSQTFNGGSFEARQLSPIQANF
jgi:hypothetical protein